MWMHNKPKKKDKEKKVNIRKSDSIGGGLKTDIGSRFEDELSKGGRDFYNNDIQK